MKQEPTIFSLSSPGRRAVDWQPDSIYDYDRIDDPLMTADFAQQCRSGSVEGLPEVAELDIMRHYTHLSATNFHVDGNFYPLGSCTMKYNPRINEKIASLSGFTLIHPNQPEEELQGALQVLWETQEYLKKMSGMDAVSLQPAAGAQGELTALLMFKAYFRDKQQNRDIILVPESAHGTNPASAAIAGFSVQSFATGSNGLIDIAVMQAKIAEIGVNRIAGVMVTNPNTLGFFEKDIRKVADLLHGIGGLLYIDGANFNAILGKTHFGLMGADAVHFNLHKTFASPHGGGGPGSGPVAVCQALADYLPGPVVTLTETQQFNSLEPARSIGKVKAYWGNFGVILRALSYMKAMGAEHLSEIAEGAVLNANYIKKRLKEFFHLPFEGHNLHEVVFSDKNLAQQYGITTLDLAKALLDYGFHAPTVYFPLIVSGAIMIEPTETENKDTLDQFCNAVIDILKRAKENAASVKSSPSNQPIGRLDEVQAARNPVLVYRES